MVKHDLHFNEFLLQAFNLLGKDNLESFIHWRRLRDRAFFAVPKGRGLSPCLC
jgi:hypothetical protein